MRNQKQEFMFRQQIPNSDTSSKCKTLTLRVHFSTVKFYHQCRLMVLSLSGDELNVFHSILIIDYLLFVPHEPRNALFKCDPAFKLEQGERLKKYEFSYR